MEMYVKRNKQMEIPTQVLFLETKIKAPISCRARSGNTDIFVIVSVLSRMEQNLYLAFYGGLHVLLPYLTARSVH
jgi:hypothetical protein